MDPRPWTGWRRSYDYRYATLTNCTLSGNSADDGGAVKNLADTTLTDSTAGRDQLHAPMSAFTRTTSVEPTFLL